MEQNQISCGSVCDRLPPLSAKYPWLVAQNVEPKEEKENTGELIFYTVQDPLSRYRCRIPELIGKRIEAYFYGWVILSNYPHNNLWSLWNPLTSKTIHFPPLILKDLDYTSIKHCCLSSPPNDPTSVLMLMRTKQRTIVFCRLDCIKKRLKWTEMTYAKQLKSITGGDGYLHCITCCNGKVYALNFGRVYHFVIHIDIVVNGKEVVINLLPLSKLPPTPLNDFGISSFLKGCCTELFFIELGFDLVKKTLDAVCVFKLDMSTLIWEEVKDLKDAILFVDLGRYCSVFYNSAIASELGGYIHILGYTGEIIYSYNVKDNTISPSYMPCLMSTSHVSLWECRLQGDFKPVDKIVVRDEKVDIVTSTRNEPNEKNSDSHILNIPFDILKMIMERCVGVEYLNFRATCKDFHLIAPMIHWSNKTQVKKLQTYSLVSPWLMVFDKHQGIITFIDPMFGNKYFIKTPRELIGNLRLRCCKYGWLLMFKVSGPVVFYNPFTNDIRKLPFVPFLESFSFSAPPTSPDCMVVGFTPNMTCHVYVLFLNRVSIWRRFEMDFGGPVPRSFLFPTFYDGNIYTLNEGRLDVFREIELGNCSWDVFVADAPCSSRSSDEESDDDRESKDEDRVVQYFLVKCDTYLLLVIVDEFGESVEVFKLNENDSKQQWEKIDSLGKHMIYISGTTCLCMEAKTPEMENKIYFPRLHSENGKIVFYSLETCKYHTFNGRNIEESFADFIGTKYLCYPHAWIEPSWC